VQTATFGNSTTADVIELLGWVFLSVSGVIALLRFRMQPVGYRVYAELSVKKDLLEQYEAERTNGSTEVVMTDTQERLPIETVISELQNTILRNEEISRNLNERLIRQHAWHLYMFVFGFLAIAVSRAVPGIEAIIRHLCP
jgi:hypothetical protein